MYVLILRFSNWLHRQYCCCAVGKADHRALERRHQKYDQWSSSCRIWKWTCR